MSSGSAISRRALPRGWSRLLLCGVPVVAAVAAVWLAIVLRAPGDSGSLDSRVTDVGATVRCPVCLEPVPLNDVQGSEAQQMRGFIRHELQRGLSEDQVRQELALPKPQGYGPDILLAPPQRGFDLLAWLVPLAAVAACAVGVLVTVRRWSAGSAPPAAPVTALSSSPESRRYEELLDRELAARE